ncbi:hypothetical protein Dimus_007226 [Dionaea muscipula]
MRINITQSSTLSKQGNDLHRIILYEISTIPSSYDPNGYSKFTIEIHPSNIMLKKVAKNYRIQYTCQKISCRSSNYDVKNEPTGTHCPHNLTISVLSPMEEKK